MSYENIQRVLDEVGAMMKDHPHTSKDIGYGWRWTFSNSLWFDIIDYRKANAVFLRVGRGAWLVRKHPILFGVFDEVKKVIAKIEIHSPATLEEKNIAGILALLAEQEKGHYGVFDDG